MVLERDISLYCNKKNSQARDTMLAKDFEGVTYMYRLRAMGAAKPLLVTQQSSPLIPDGELPLYFRRFGVVEVNPFLLFDLSR